MRGHSDILKILPTKIEIFRPGVPPLAVAQDNTKKYLMIGGAIVLAGGTLYLVTRKKGKGR